MVFPIGTPKRALEQPSALRPQTSLYRDCFQALDLSRLAIPLPPQLAVAWTPAGGEMAESNVEREIATAQESVGEVRLWQAVIVRTIEAWISGPLRQRRLAENYLFDDKRDFAMVCESAGLDPDDMRARLTIIRNRDLHANKVLPAEIRNARRISFRPGYCIGLTDSIKPKRPSASVGWMKTAPLSTVYGAPASIKAPRICTVSPPSILRIAAPRI
jgi:hypothetical protein